MKSKYFKIMMASLVTSILLIVPHTAFSLSIGGPRGFDFGPDGNLYFSQGPTSAFPDIADDFEGVVTLTGDCVFSTFPVFTFDGSQIHWGFRVGPVFTVSGTLLAEHAGDIWHFDSAGVLMEHFGLTSSHGKPSWANSLILGPNGNLFVSIAVRVIGGNTFDTVIQEYTTTGVLVCESGRLTWTGGTAHLSFAPDGILHVASRYGGRVDGFDANFNMVSSQTFTEIDDPRDFYIDSAGNFIFTWRTPNETTGTLSLYSPTDDQWLHIFIDEGIPLEIIQVPQGTSFAEGNYLVGLMTPLPHYGRILEFDSNLELVRSCRAVAHFSLP